MNKQKIPMILTICAEFYDSSYANYIIDVDLDGTLSSEIKEHFTGLDANFRYEVFHDDWYVTNPNIKISVLKQLANSVIKVTLRAFPNDDDFIYDEDGEALELKPGMPTKINYEWKWKWKMIPRKNNHILDGQEVAS